MTSLHNRLQVVIHTLKLSKQALAESGSVSAQTISAYLKGETLPNQKVLANWVKAYSLNAHWLLTGEGEMFIDPLDLPLSHPLAKSVNQVALTMADSGVDELKILLAVQSMVEGELNKLVRARGGYGAAEPKQGLANAAEGRAPYGAQGNATDDDTGGDAA